ncbi:MAG: hypothetical protein KAJ42_10610 [Gemmatimonadetes bacterium]|nr:hypothetical protein [Gemmatimonadota bacterium]
MAPVFEFVGGPWDGEIKAIHEGNEIHIHMNTMPTGASMIVTDPLDYPEPRIGVYRLVRRRDWLTYYKWMGEQ